MIRFLPLFFAAWLFADGHILLYHRVGDTKPSGESMNVSVSKLREQMQYLKDNGYKVIPLSQMVELVKSGKPIDDKTVTITIDDAYKSFYVNGVPVLKQFGYPYALMVYVEAVDKKWPDYMTWNDVNDVVKSGAEIGLHSYGHVNLTEIPLEAATKDTQKGLTDFKERTKTMPKYYAYPFGAYNANVKKEIESIGVVAILTTDSGGIAPSTDLMAMPRSAINSHSDIKSILKMKALNVKITQEVLGNGEVKVTGHVIDANISKLGVYIAKNNRKTISVKDGKFELIVDKNNMNQKRKLIFYDGAYTVAKTLPL